MGSHQRVNLRCLGQQVVRPRRSISSYDCFALACNYFCQSSNVIVSPNFLLVFAGKDASRALAQSSLKPEDCRPEYDDLGEKEQGVLNDWLTFFTKRYNIIGRVQG